MTGHEHPTAIGGRLLDGFMKILLVLFLAAAAVMAVRFLAGLGPVTNMTDGYPWGIWEPVNVVVFTGIGAGAYAVGLLCYVFNHGRYHGLVRPAVLLGAIAYSLGGSSVIIALGRYWNIYWMPLPGMWNLNSVLLEVAVCVISYVCVLWVEVLPAVFDGAAGARSPGWAAWGKKWGARLAAAMPFIIALAMLLPTMHQNSLAGLMLIGGPKVHPLWHTALLPTLGLISCLSMGFGAMVVLTTILKYTWNGAHDQELLAKMSKVNAGFLLAYSALRLGDIAVHGKLRYLLVPDFHLFFFLLEMALFLVPAVLFLRPRVQQNRGRLFGAALMVLFGGALYRVDFMLTAYYGGPGWEYMPSLGELTVTVGMAAIGTAVFIFVSRLFPVVVVDTRRHRAAGTTVRAAASR